MSNVKEFGDTARALAKNPLGIIALFIVLIYGFACLVVSTNNHLQPTERYPLIWFLAIFPVIVLIAFAWLVSCHHEKLYAPRDFKSDEAFFRGMYEKREARPSLIELDRQIGETVKRVLISEELTANLDNRNEIIKRLQGAASKITQEIRKSSFITVDARKLTGSDTDVFEFPIGAFATFNRFTDEVYFLIANYVDPYEYGYSWVIRDARDDRVIKNTRMITGTQPGIPLDDTRTLKEVGIEAGMVLEVIRVQRSDAPDVAPPRTA